MIIPTNWKDETYDEATDPLTGTVTDTIECTITGGLSSGSISQTVTASYEITPIAFDFSTTCTESFIVTASGLPPGISIVNNNSCCQMFKELFLKELELIILCYCK